MPEQVRQAVVVPAEVKFSDLVFPGGNQAYRLKMEVDLESLIL